MNNIIYYALDVKLICFFFFHIILFSFFNIESFAFVLVLGGFFNNNNNNNMCIENVERRRVCRIFQDNKNTYIVLFY